MKRKISAVLKDIVGKSGKEILNDTDRFKAIMADILPSVQDEEVRSALVTTVAEFNAYNHNMSINEKHNASTCNFLVNKLTKQGFGENNIREAVCEICRIMDTKKPSRYAGEFSNSNNVAQVKTDMCGGNYGIVKEAYDNCQEPRSEIFISYSHKDKKYADELIEHLNPLKETYNIETWHFPYIHGCHETIDCVIGQHLKKARIVVQLLSTRYMNSSYIKEVERPIIIEAAERKELERILLLVGKIELRNEFLGRLHINGNRPPLNKYRRLADREDIYEEIAGECRRIFGFSK